MNQRKMRIGMSIRGHGYHPAAWRHPDVPADGTLQVEHYVRSAQTAERGKLDMIFFADGAGIRQGDNPPGSLARTGRDMIELEPTMLLPALAMVTSHIGLVTTASTTYNEPYNLARRFATLDLISKGRAGWNVVASWSEHEAQNFGLETTLDYDTRYARSAEFVDVVKGLWDGWDDGALLLDKAGGRYFDEAKMHVLNHHGRFFKVRGPLSVTCMPQGHPVIVQAGASESGRQLAAETAEAVFTAQSSLAVGREFYADVKGRAEKSGRSRDHIKILPGCFVVVGDTMEEARAKRAKLDSLVHYANAIGSLSIALGHDASKFDPDGPLPEIPESNASKSGRQRAIDLAKRENLTVRQLAQRLGGHSGLAMIGTPKTIADEMEEWLLTEGSDGFTVQFPYLPGGLDDFVDKVVPELQRRGLFRRDYEGKTLRENLGLPRPKNRFFDGADTARAAE